MANTSTLFSMKDNTIFLFIYRRSITGKCLFIYHQCLYHLDLGYMFMGNTRILYCFFFVAPIRRRGGTFSTRTESHI